MNELEREWALRAHEMLTDEFHIAATKAKGTLHPDDQDNPSLRYPGYLGSAFEADKGVLVIYGIHREFHSENLIVDPHGLIDNFIGASQLLQQTQAPDDEQLANYIDAHRPVYEIGLSGGWRVSSHLKAALPACGPSFDREGMKSIAYLNVSCAQFPELHREVDDASRKSWLKRNCAKTHPVASVVEMLRPSVVLCASSPGYATLRKAGVGGTLATVFYNQNGGYLEQPIVFADGQVIPANSLRADWTAALRRQAANAGMN